MIAHAQLPKPIAQSSSLVLGDGEASVDVVSPERVQTDEENFTSFILGLSEAELDDFLTGQIEDESSMSESEPQSDSPGTDLEFTGSPVELLTPSDVTTHAPDATVTPILVCSCPDCKACRVKFKYCLLCGRGACNHCLLTGSNWTIERLQENAWICTQCDCL